MRVRLWCIVNERGVADASLVRYLKTEVQDSHLIFVATLDEASYQSVQSRFFHNKRLNCSYAKSKKIVQIYFCQNLMKKFR